MFSHWPYLLFAHARSFALSVVAATMLAQTERIECGEEKKAMVNPAASQEVFEILTLDIKPGRRDEFHNVYVAQSVPLLKKWNFNLVAYGPSLHDTDSYYVIRRFKNLEEREKSEDAFYSSNDWKSGPRDTIMGLVEHFAYAVVSAETWKKISTAVTIKENHNRQKREENHHGETSTN
jgi:NIPSNAP